MSEGINSSLESRPRLAAELAVEARKLCHERPMKRLVRYTIGEHMVPLNEPGTVLTEQHDICGDPGHSGPEGGGPGRTCHRPGRKTLAQRAGLHRGACVVQETEIVHAVLGSPLPHRTLWNRAPPQLTQIQMEAHDVTGQACVDVRPTMRAFSGAEVAELALALPTLGLHLDLMLCHPRQQGRRPMLPQDSQVPCRRRTIVAIKSFMRRSWVQRDHRRPRPGLCSGKHRAAPGPAQPLHERHADQLRPGQQWCPGPQHLANSGRHMS